MAETGAQAENAATDAEKFKQSLEDLAGQTRKRNIFEVFVDVVFMTDINTAIAILHVKAEMNKRFKDLEKTVGKQETGSGNTIKNKTNLGRLEQHLRRLLKKQSKPMMSLFRNRLKQEKS